MTLTDEQMDVLNAMALDGDDLTEDEIMDAAERSQAVVMRVLWELRDAGYVTELTAEEDGRTVWMILPAGAAAFNDRRDELEEQGAW